MLAEVQVRLVQRFEEPRYQELMQAHHYLGSLPKIGETLWYVATYRGEWIALLSFSSAAWKCGVRDLWIGWDFRRQFDRLNLISNNSRFLILEDWHIQNLASRILSLCEKRLPVDWLSAFGHPLLLVETFVDPERFHGTIYQAANWTYLGDTKGFRRTRQGYSPSALSPKKVFVKPLQTNARMVLSQPLLEPAYQTGAPRIMLSAEHMRALPDFFTDIPDPRRRQGRLHWLPCVLAIATGATLCGMRGYNAIAHWARSLNQKARERFRCRRDDGHYVVPSETIIRDCLVRVDSVHLDRALQRWNTAYGEADSTLILDGKIMKNAVEGGTSSNSCDEGSEDALQAA